MSEGWDLASVTRKCGIMKCTYSVFIVLNITLLTTLFLLFFCCLLKERERKRRRERGKRGRKGKEDFFNIYNFALNVIITVTNN